MWPGKVLQGASIAFRCGLTCGHAVSVHSFDLEASGGRCRLRRAIAACGQQTNLGRLCCWLAPGLPPLCRLPSVVNSAARDATLPLSHPLAQVLSPSPASSYAEQIPMTRRTSGCHSWIAVLYPSSIPRTNGRQTPISGTRTTLDSRT
jgi:hypothetical protein